MWPKKLALCNLCDCKSVQIYKTKQFICSPMKRHNFHCLSLHSILTGQNIINEGLQHPHRCIFWFISAKVRIYLAYLFTPTLPCCPSLQPVLLVSIRPSLPTPTAPSVLLTATHSETGPTFASATWDSSAPTLTLPPWPAPVRAQTHTNS